MPEVNKKQIEKANETAYSAFEVVKRIYDLYFISRVKISKAIALQLGLTEKIIWGRDEKKYRERCGQLTEGEHRLKRYFYTIFLSTKKKKLSHHDIPFILFSIVTRNLKELPPSVIYGILNNVKQSNGLKQKEIDVDPFMYIISEKRESKPLVVLGKNTSTKWRAEVDFRILSLFEITDDTIGNIIKKIGDWFNKNLKVESL